MLDYSHNGWLVAASLLVALMAAFSGLSLTRGASGLDLGRRKLVVVLSAVVLGGGIWAMHFVAMLGLQLPILFYYDGLYTLISALIAILVVGAALLLLHFLPRNRLVLTAAGVLVGTGIVGMHYVGMLGMELCRPVFEPFGTTLAVISALGLSVLAIFIAYGARTRGNILMGTVVFGLCVFVVHFVAMWGTGFQALASPDAVGPSISNEALAMGVAITAFLISGAFLLTGVSYVGPGQAPDVPQVQATQSPSAEASQAKQAEPIVALVVPYEKHGRTQFLEAAKIAAIRAEGHYTILYTGAEKLFCPWSISEAQKRLEGGQFLRAHRSYLINPTHVTEFKRLKDTGACFFAQVDALAKVPVSRSRLAEVRAALGA
jgi:NO-binding membrane sensor protein with MHYT domain